MLRIAVGLSLNHGKEDRKYKFAAVAVRTDGVIVFATNGGVSGERTPAAHAETRVSRKADVGSVVYVGRTLRGSGQVAMARPCVGCQMAMRNRGVSRCHYTINENESGVIYF